ncbi:MAG TPA: LuxR C-terminal-related transcriptional regulator [Mycobacteriales bacterium]|nr:LuxR C-terminal-related transcriptional regulator [Mycobacteriales bacterium]
MVKSGAAGPARHVVWRPRLAAALDAAVGAAPLTLVLAGPGTGKTALLADWSRRQSRAVRSFAAGTLAEPAEFWRTVLHRLSTDSDLTVPGAWRPGTAPELVDAAFSAAPEIAEPPVVVLDDADALVDRDIGAGIDHLVRWWPRRVRLVLAARGEPQLPLHRYRLAEQVREISTPDLAMTRSEAAELLTARGVVLTDPDLDALMRRTEGWAAALDIAAAALAAGADAATFLDGLARPGNGVATYVATEVLKRQPTEVRRLLLRTSVLEEFSGSLADAVTGGGGSAERLARLARDGAFVVALDPTYTRFRCHRLVRDVLRSILSEESPRATDEIYASAAQWHHRVGDPLAALRWAARERDPRHAVRLLLHGGLAAALAQDVDLAREELPALAAEEADEAEDAAARDDPGEAAVLPWVLAAATCDANAAPAALVELTPVGPGADVSDPELALAAYVAEVVLAGRAGAHEVLERCADRLDTDPAIARQASGTPGLAARMRLLRARCRFATGRPEDVAPLLLRALQQVAPDDPPGVQLDILAVLAMASASAARPSHFEEAVSRAQALLRENPGLSRPVPLDLAIARHAHVRADFATMRAALARAVAVGPIYPDAGLAAAVAFLRATLLADSGQVAAAEALLRETPALHDARAGLIAVYACCERAALKTATGQPSAALQVLQRYAGTPYALCGAVVEARAHLALGDVNGAQRCVRTVLTTPSPLVNRYLFVDGVICDAEIALHRGDDDAALAALLRAIDIAGGDIILPFVRVSDPVAPLLARHAAVAARWPAAWPQAAAVPAVPPQRDGEVGLTGRERDVLALLATPKSTAEIADELSVSVTTVKTHVGAIYRKLGVGRRREAVLRARSLDLL